MQRFSEEKLMPIFVTGRESAAFVAHQLIHQSCLVYITLTGVAQFLKEEEKKKKKQYRAKSNRIICLIAGI